MVRNVYETKVDGKKIGFKCGTMAIAIACRKADCRTVNELLARMAEQDLLAILALFYGSACQYFGNEKPDFTMDTVSDWVEAMGEDESQKATMVLLETFKSKNVPAPKRGAKK